MSQIPRKLSHEPKAGVTIMRSEAFFSFFRGIYTTFRHSKRKVVALRLHNTVKYVLYAYYDGKFIIMKLY